MIRDGVYYALAFTAGGALVSWLVGPWKAMPLSRAFGAFCAPGFSRSRTTRSRGPRWWHCHPPMVASCKWCRKAIGRPGSGIFLNIFDVHVNRSPISGVISDITYKRGQFMVASGRKRSPRRRTNKMSLSTVRKRRTVRKVVVKQTRRIDRAPHPCTKRVGDFRPRLESALA